jgi:hypothetical protein
MVYGLKGFGLRVEGLGFRIKFGIQGFGLRAHGLWS